MAQRQVSQEEQAAQMHVWGQPPSPEEQAAPPSREEQAAQLHIWKRPPTQDEAGLTVASLEATTLASRAGSTVACLEATNHIR